MPRDCGKSENMRVFFTLCYVALQLLNHIVDMT